MIRFKCIIINNKLPFYLILSKANDFFLLDHCFSCLSKRSLFKELLLRTLSLAFSLILFPINILIAFLIPYFSFYSFPFLLSSPLITSFFSTISSYLSLVNSYLSLAISSLVSSLFTLLGCSISSLISGNSGS